MGLFDMFKKDKKASKSTSPVTKKVEPKQAETKKPAATPAAKKTPNKK